MAAPTAFKLAVAHQCAPRTRLTLLL
ncbi:hypothetical protein CKAH01_12746 [Colletotrichum kahawae]|uniref:Uncharacterized protein n=1 Tax=Colletotrichum kahawae TaxID=34407 RepID=A0AAE0DC46_COLKA|nr:hypothetical protein CKAH01_12746 [Colletotrichum kahawae]